MFALRAPEIIAEYPTNALSNLPQMNAGTTDIPRTGPSAGPFLLHLMDFGKPMRARLAFGDGLESGLGWRAGKKRIRVH
jgi:hypothetical protein